MKRGKWQWTVTKGVVINAFDGNGERFARLFRETWRYLPLRVRRTLKRNWRIGFPALTWSPCIDLTEGWARMGDDDIAAVYCRGHHLRFCSEKIDRLPDDEVRHTIAHELAHCIQEFEGTFTREQHKWYASRGLAYMSIEGHADELATEWLSESWNRDNQDAPQLNSLVRQGVQKIVDGKAANVVIIPQ